MKKILMVIAFIAILAGCSGEKEISVAPLRVDGIQLTADGQPVTFNGISFGWHNLWPRFYNAQAVKSFAKDWNVKIIRAAIGADNFANQWNPGCHSGYLDEPELAMESLYNVIDGAIESGVYVIVDWHSHLLHPEEAAEFFAAVAQKYKGVPNVIYELCNEPVCGSFEVNFGYEDLGNQEAMEAYWQTLKKYCEDLIEVITSIDSSNPLILVGCPSWDQRIDLPAADPITMYSNLMYTVHFYAGTHKQELRDRCDAAMASGIPVFISECAGCNADGDGDIDMESWKEWKTWAEANGITMMEWSVGDKNETCSFFTPEASSEGPWPEEVIKPWAKIVKESIN